MCSEETRHFFFKSEHAWNVSPKSCSNLQKIEDVFYVKGSTKRMITNRHPKSYKHHQQNDFVRRIIQERWNTGLAISKSELLRLTLQQFKDDLEWMKIYGNRDKRGNNKLNMFLDRAIGKAGYASRKLTISQKIPTNWRELAESGG